MTIIDDIRAVKKQQEDTLQTVRNLANGASMKVWRDAEWTILHCRDGSGAQTTISMRSDTAFDIAYALTPELGERHDRYCKARDALYEMEYPSVEQVSLRVGDLGTLVDADGAQHGISFNPRLDRVFAAAPEMYAALCAVMSDADDLDLDLIADLSPDTVNLINAALLKADGRS